MPRVPGTTDRQSSFLRAFLKSPSGPPPADWPSPALLRKWLRRPSFRRAADSLLSSLRFRADFHLSTAAAGAVQSLAHSAASPGPQQLDAPDLSPLYRLLRLAHLRQRFSPSGEAPSDPPHSAPSTQHSDAPFTAPPLRRIGEPRPSPHPDFVPDLTPRQLQLVAQKHGLKAIDRIPAADFLQPAQKRGYHPPLEKAPCFPDPSVPPASPAERFYYELLKCPSALLWYLKRYTEETGDHRYKSLLAACPHIIPHRQPWQNFPQFTAKPPPMPP